MNIILTALIAAAMGALVELLPRPVRMVVYRGGVLGACTGATSDIAKGDNRETMHIL